MPTFRRYRVNLSFRGFRANSIIEIDDEDPGWQPYLDREYLSLVGVAPSELGHGTLDALDYVDEVARQAVPDPAVVPGEWDRGGMGPDDDA